MADSDERFVADLARELTGAVAPIEYATELTREVEMGTAAVGDLVGWLA